MTWFFVGVVVGGPIWLIVVNGVGFLMEWIKLMKAQREWNKTHAEEN
jgi:hypothetical protein